MAFKGLMGGAAGAALYTAYRDSDTLFNSKDIASGLLDIMRRSGSGSGNLEVSRLQKNVDDLQHALLKSLHDRQPTVIYAGNSKSGVGTATGVVLVVGGVALYLRFVKGWRLADLMYVTRSSLSSLTESMKSGMESMKAQFEERATHLLERMGALGAKQEELLEAQGALGSELALVGGKVSEVSDQVGFSNHAILLLCGALSEMAKRVGISNGRYVKELEHLSRSVHSLPAGAGGAAVPAGGGGGLTALPSAPFGDAAFFHQAHAAAAAGGPAAASLPGPAGFGPNPSMHAVTAGLSSSVSSAGGAAAADERGGRGVAAVAGGAAAGGARGLAAGDPSQQAKLGSFAGLWGGR